MKLGIMQPYFVPYIGYWQLMNVVDKYVIYDDVNFIKGGWINRNRILVNGEPKYYNIPMLGSSPYKLINQVKVNLEDKLISKNIRIIEGAYKKAPYYNNVLPLIERMLRCTKSNIAEFIEESFYIINEYLGIETELIMSSSLNKDNTLKGQEKVLSICKLLNASEYYNSAGGQELYSFSDFKSQGIMLKFLKSKEIIYKQFDNEFKDNLSILDVMMFNSQQQVREFLNEYDVMTD